MSFYDKIFAECKTIAVVGLSSNPSRPSFGVSRYMQSVGYRIIPVNPKVREVLGERSYSQLEDIPFPIDIVDVFRRPEYVEPIVESAIKIGAKVIWMQEGVFHQAAAEKARRAGMIVVIDRCILKEHVGWVYNRNHSLPSQSTSEVF
jgi:hypothetical protein